MESWLRRRIAMRLAWMQLRQSDLARVIGIDPSSLSRTMRSDQPTPKSLARLAHALGWSTNDLLAEGDAGSIIALHPASDRRSCPPTIEQLSDWYEATWPEVEADL